MEYKGFTLPDDLLYNTDSSWVKIEGDVALVGINEAVAKAVKEFLFISFATKKEISKGETYVSLEALKWSGHLTSPVSGKIIAFNEELYDEPEVINKKPYDSWIMKVELSDQSELSELKKPEDIISWLDEVVN